jgi:hypothetical protein
MRRGSVKNLGDRTSPTRNQPRLHRTHRPRHHLLPGQNRRRSASPYKLFPPELLEFAEKTIADYNELVANWGDETLSDENVPHPTAVLRLTPPV